MSMLRWIAVLGFLLLAACQQPQSAGPAQPARSTSALSGSDSEGLPSDWGELGGKEQPDSKYFAAEIKETRNRMLVELVGDCYRELKGTEFDGCLRKALAAKFDASGEGRDKCARQPDLDTYATCMIVGNVSIDFLRRLDSQVKIEDDIWDSPRAFGDAIDKVAISNAIVVCADRQTEREATTCAFDWVLSRVDLPERLARKCSADLASKERTACIGEAATLRFIEEHLSRAPGTSI